MEQIGPDLVSARGSQVVVDSPARMPDWEVRAYRKALILYRGGRYFVSRRAAQPGGRTLYVLDPWPDDSQDEPSREILYDAAYVAARERNLAAERRGRLLPPFVLPLVPLAGFLPSSWKAALHERYGIDARTATRLSLWIEYFVIGGCMATFAIFSIAGAIGGGLGDFPLRLLLVVAALLAPDVVARYHSLLADQMAPPGFYEWAFRKPRAPS